MGTWGTSIKDSDAFEDIYSEFFELYNKGEKPGNISKKIVADNWEMLEIEEEKHSLWFALALAQWETKSLDPEILLQVEEIINSGYNLKLWLDLGANESDIKKRKIALENFLQKLKSERPKAKSRKKTKSKIPVFSTGDCLVFKINNGNYGGAIVLATDTNPETAYNLVATTRLNNSKKPSLQDFEKSEVLVCNFGNWEDRPDINWYMPDLFFKSYADLYEVIGKIEIQFEYDPQNRTGDGYLFKPMYTAGWSMNNILEKQLNSERSKPKPTGLLFVKQIIKNNK